MVHSQILDVVDNQVVVKLPAEFKGKKKVLVTIDDHVEEFLKKMELMRLAAKDPLFMADIKAVEEDFTLIVHEQL